jgi:hypothetical protein
MARKKLRLFFRTESIVDVERASYPDHDPTSRAFFRRWWRDGNKTRRCVRRGLPARDAQIADWYPRMAAERLVVQPPVRAVLVYSGQTVRKNSTAKGKAPPVRA